MENERKNDLIIPKLNQSEGIDVQNSMTMEMIESNIIKKSLPLTTDNGTAVAITTDPDEDYDDGDDDDDDEEEDDDDDDDDDDDYEDDNDDNNEMATTNRRSFNETISNQTVKSKNILPTTNPTVYFPFSSSSTTSTVTNVKTTSAMIMPPSYDSIFNNLIIHQQPPPVSQPAPEISLTSGYWPAAGCDSLLSSSSSSSMIMADHHHHLHQLVLQNHNQQQQQQQPEIDSSYDSDPDSEMQKIVQDVVDSGNSTTPEQEGGTIMEESFIFLPPQPQQQPPPPPPEIFNSFIGGTDSCRRSSPGGNRKKKLGKKKNQKIGKKDWIPNESSKSYHEEIDRTTSETLSQEYKEYVTHAMITTANNNNNNNQINNLNQESLSENQKKLFESKLLFAKKRGYTELQVKRALEKIGYECQQNELLQELINISSSTNMIGSGDQSLLISNSIKKNHQPLVGSISSSILMTGNRITVGKTLSSPVTGLSSSSSSSVTNSNSANTSAANGRSSSSSSNSGNNRVVELRSIVIDGSNVAMNHGKQQSFSCKGIEICVDYFRSRGHQDITIFVPSWRKYNADFDLPIKDREILLKLEEQGLLFFTPARSVSGRMVASYDDRYILNHALKHESIIVSNDQYRDLISENSDFKKMVNERLLMYLFVGDEFIPPDDPLGQHGPKLDKFLSKSITDNNRNNNARFNQICPYDKKCTYGHKCKYFHPERQQQPGGNKLKTSSNDLLHGSNNSLINSVTSGSKLRMLKSLPNQSTSNTNLSVFTETTGTVHGKKPLFRTKSSVSIETDLTNSRSILTKTNSVNVCSGSGSGNQKSSTSKHKKLERQLTLNPDADPRLNNLTPTWSSINNQYSQLSNSLAALSVVGDHQTNRNFQQPQQPSPSRTNFFQQQPPAGGTKPLMIKSFSLSGSNNVPANAIYHHRIPPNTNYFNNQDFTKGTANSSGMLIIDTTTTAGGTTGDHQSFHHFHPQQPPTGGLLSTTNDSGQSFISGQADYIQQWPPIATNNKSDILGIHQSSSSSSSSFDLETINARRSKIYYHLSSLMPIGKVEHVMRSMPNETDPEVICAAILKMANDVDFASSSASAFKP